RARAATIRRAAAAVLRPGGTGGAVVSVPADTEPAARAGGARDRPLTRVAEPTLPRLAGRASRRSGPTRARSATLGGVETDLFRALRAAACSGDGGSQGREER